MTISQFKACNMPQDASPTVAIRLFRHLAQDLNLNKETEVLHAIGLLTSRKYRSFLLLTDSWAKQQYGSCDAHFAWNQLASLLKKYPFVDDSIDTEAAAMKKFFAAEALCKRVNSRFLARRARGRSPGGKPGKLLPYESYLHSARRYIQSVIGVKPDFQKIWGLCDFGPGASVGVSGSLTHSAVKLSGEWSCTPLCAPYASAAMVGDHHIWESLLGYPVCYDKTLFDEAFVAKLSFVRANKIISVPKTALVDRTIAIEPVLNGYVQKGVDNYMRRKLLRAGIDLSDQTYNQRLAKLGAEGGFNPFATIDLSAASDSISIELVRELLPPDWFSFLNDIRSHHFLSGGSEQRYQKFTSMGNGFCFPLETLIFASIVHSAYEVTGDGVFSVYGDDIIVRQSSALLVLELLKYCGFKANVDKTFIHGPFRESCGADFFEGVNVRPYYLDSVPRKWGDLFGVLNGLRKALSICDSEAWRGIFYLIPESKRLVRFIDGPDTAITVPMDIFMSSRYTKWHIHEQRWSWRELLITPVSDHNSYSSAIMMYGITRGLASKRGTVDYTHRRKTSTRIRSC